LCRRAAVSEIQKGEKCSSQMEQQQQETAPPALGVQATHA